MKSNAPSIITLVQQTMEEFNETICNVKRMYNTFSSKRIIYNEEEFHNKCVEFMKLLADFYYEEFDTNTLIITISGNCGNYFVMLVGNQLTFSPMVEILDNQTICPLHLDKVFDDDMIESALCIAEWCGTKTNCNF